MAPLTRLLQLPQISYVEELLQNRRVLVAGLHHHPPLEALAGAAQVTVIEPSSIRIAYAQRRLETHNVEYICTPLHQTGLTVASFDVVLTGSLPLETAEGRALLTELRRLLDPEGCLIFSQPGPGSLLADPLRPNRLEDPNRFHLVLRRYFSYVELLYHQTSLTSVIAPTLHALPSWRASTPPELPPGQDFLFLCSQIPVQAEEKLIASTSLLPWKLSAQHQVMRIAARLQQSAEALAGTQRRVEVLERLLQTLPVADEQPEQGLSPNTETVALPINSVELQALKDTITGLTLTLQTRDQTVDQLQAELSRLQARMADQLLALEEAEGTLETSERLRQLQSERLEEAAQLLEHQYQEREALRARGEALQTALEQARESARALPAVLAESGLVLEAAPPPEEVVPAQAEVAAPAPDTAEHVIQALAPNDAEEALRLQRIYYEELLTKERLKTWMLEEKLEALSGVYEAEDRGWTAGPMGAASSDVVHSGAREATQAGSGLSARAHAQGVAGRDAVGMSADDPQSERADVPGAGPLRDPGTPSGLASAAHTRLSRGDGAAETDFPEPATRSGLTPPASDAGSAHGTTGRSGRALFEEERTDELEASLQTEKPHTAGERAEDTGGGARKGDDWFSAMFDNSIPPTRMESEAEHGASVTPKPSGALSSGELVPTGAPTTSRYEGPVPSGQAGEPAQVEADAAFPARLRPEVASHTPRETPSSSSPVQPSAPSPEPARELASPTPREQHDGLDTPFTDELEEVEQEALPPVRRQGDVFSRPFRALDQTIETSQLSPSELKGLEDGGLEPEEPSSPDALPLPPLPKPDEATQRALLDDWDKPADRLLMGTPPIPPAPGKSADQLLEGGAATPAASVQGSTPGARESSGGTRSSEVQRVLEQLVSAEAALAGPTLAGPERARSKPEEAPVSVRAGESQRHERGPEGPSVGPTPLMPGRVTWPASPGEQAEALDLPQRGELALLDALSRMNAAALPSVTQQEEDELEQVTFDPKHGLGKRPAVELPPALSRPSPPIPAALDRRRRVRPIQERSSALKPPPVPELTMPSPAASAPPELADSQPSATFMKRFLGKFWK